MSKFRIFAAAAIFLSGSAGAARLNKDEQRAIAATPEQVAASAAIVDDPLDTKIRVDTKNFFLLKQGLLKITNGDKYFRAFIDRKTGATVLQLVMWQTHGSGWQFWDHAVAEGPQGPVELKGHRLDSDVDCARYGCTYMESLAIDVDEGLLKWVAADARPGADHTWKFKIYGRYVEGVPTGILKTEAAGFLIAVERAKSRVARATPPSSN